MLANCVNLFIVRLTGACLAMTMLHACQHYATSEPQPSPPNHEKAMQALSLDRNADPAEVAAAKKQCTALDGFFEQAGRLGRYMCFARYSDAGKPCSDATDCQGTCRADVGAESGQKAVGHCTADNNPFGCYARVEQGVVSPFLCVD